MKNSWKEFGLGLLKFIFAWAFVRVILRQPDMELQDKDILVIVGATFAFSWLILAFIKEEWSGLIVATNIVIATIFFYFKWGDFGLMYAQIALGSLLIMSVIIFGYEFVKTLKNERGAWLPTLVNSIVLAGFLFGLEEILQLFFLTLQLKS